MIHRRNFDDQRKQRSRLISFLSAVYVLIAWVMLNWVGHTQPRSFVDTGWPLVFGFDYSAPPYDLLVLKWVVNIFTGAALLAGTMFGVHNLLQTERRSFQLSIKDIFSLMATGAALFALFGLRSQIASVWGPQVGSWPSSKPSS